MQDSPDGAGGFTLWPGSHRWLFEQIGRKVLPEADGCNQVGKTGGGAHAPVPHPLPSHHLARRTTPNNRSVELSLSVSVSVSVSVCLSLRWVAGFWDTLVCRVIMEQVELILAVSPLSSV